VKHHKSRQFNSSLLVKISTHILVCHNVILFSCLLLMWKVDIVHSLPFFSALLCSINRMKNPNQSWNISTVLCQTADPFWKFHENSHNRQYNTLDATRPLSTARATLYVYDLAVFNLTYISAIFACSIYNKTLSYCTVHLIRLTHKQHKHYIKSTITDWLSFTYINTSFNT